MQSASEQPRGHRGQGCRSVQGKPEWSHGFIFRRVLRRFACGRHCGGARVGSRLVEVVDQDRGAVLAEQACDRRADASPRARDDRAASREHFLEPRVERRYGACQHGAIR